MDFVRIWKSLANARLHLLKLKKHPRIQHFSSSYTSYTISIWVMDKWPTSFKKKLCKFTPNGRFDLLFFYFFETEGQHANAKAHEAVDHLASFLSSSEEISQPGFEPPTSSLRNLGISPPPSNSSGSFWTSSLIEAQWLPTSHM